MHIHSAFALDYTSSYTGRHNCLWCLITSEELKIPIATRGAKPPRTLQGIKDDYARFLANGGIHTKVKEFNNAMAPHFFDIEIQQVQHYLMHVHNSNSNLCQICLPGLHITLGVFYRLFSLLEDECHKLDIQMAALSSPNTADKPRYARYVASINEERLLRDKNATSERHIVWMEQTLTQLTLNSLNPATDPSVKSVATEVKAEKKRLGRIVSDLSRNSNSKSFLPS